MVTVAFLLGARNLRDVAENKSASSLVVSLGSKRDAPTFMWKTGGPDASEIATPKRGRTSHLKDSNTIRFFLNGG